MNHKLLFLTLNTFSATGGIEKVCRAAGKALHESDVENKGVTTVYSLYDETAQIDERYFPVTAFKGFAGNKGSFVFSAVRQGMKSNVVLLSHVNLLPIGYLIKKTSPKTKLVLIAHGIEVWESVAGFKGKMLNVVDLFLPVSSYTAQKLRTQHKIEADKIKLLNNCLDPFLQTATHPALQNNLCSRYAIGKNDFVLLTVTRLKHSEQYKGYDRVVEALATIKQDIPTVKYIIVGKYDEEEKQRLDNLIAAKGLTNHVVFTGFVNEEELSAHFNIADVYIMPSTGEGFGIVFIEALYYGLPVIAGNVDGSVDALANGEFGVLVNPSNVQEIASAIRKVCEDKSAYLPNAQAVMNRFGFDAYKRKLALAVRNLQKEPSLSKKAEKTSLQSSRS